METAHILLLNRSFWPDTEATGQILTELCSGLAARYRVTVIAGRSYYAKVKNKETFNGIHILRVPHTIFWKGSFLGRMINWLTYCFLTFFTALGIKARVIIACTDPPLLGIIAMIIGFLKGTPFIYYCMDLYPDLAIGIGKLQPGPISALFDYLNRKALRRAHFIISLGLAMEKKLEDKGALKKQIRTIPTGVDTSLLKPVAKTDNPLLEKFGLKDKFLLMYIGNIGLSQEFSSILSSLSGIKDRSSFYLVFVGEGAGKDGLQNEIKALGLKNALFFPYQPRDASLLSMADLHIIPLKKGVAGTSVPSKVYSIMAAGRPYLAIADRESEISRMAIEYGCGLWAAPRDIKTIAENIEWALNHRTELEKMGRIGRQIAVDKFDKNIVIKDWFNLLESLS